MKNRLFAILFSSFFAFTVVYANPVMSGDTCLINDECYQAISFPSLVTNADFVCLSGCNLNAGPDDLTSGCQMGDFPTVWYRLTMADDARVLNIQVHSAEFLSPVISIFSAGDACQEPVPVQLPTGFECLIGAGGLAQLSGLHINPVKQYYIAVSSLYSVGGVFDICVNVTNDGFICVQQRSLHVVDRSGSGSLEGPFEPEETVRICMNVDSYSGVGNGCQWFQGLVPVFGNGWDPTSFDVNGQPLNAMVNGNPMGELLNGLYDTAHWDWFSDVIYHHDRPGMSIVDQDQNGRKELCMSTHEMDCPNDGIEGICCGPCWEGIPGDTLPPGWFSFGINGTCPDTVPPPYHPTRDWGDGNSCGPNMGPWKFCFDLKTRPVPDCQVDSTRKNLMVGFYTFADGEIGAWTGSASVCSRDAPTRLSLSATCGKVTLPEVDTLAPMCPGDTLRYLLNEPGVFYWEWNVSPYRQAMYDINRGDNGIEIALPLSNTTGAPVEMQAVFIGHMEASEDLLVRRISFVLNDELSCGITNAEPDVLTDAATIKLYPLPAGDEVMIEWAFDIGQEAMIDIFDAQGLFIRQIPVSPDEGRSKRIALSDLTSGVYYLSFHNQAFRYLKKIVRI